MKLGLRNDYCVALEITKDEANTLSEALAFATPNSYWTKARQSGFWDGKKRFYNKHTRKLPSGLLPYALKILHECKIRPEILDLRQSSPPLRKIPKPVEWANLLKERGFLVDPLQLDLQFQLVRTAVHNRLPFTSSIPWHRGLFSAGTGFGKTNVAFLLQRVHQGRFLYLESDRGRLLQAKESYEQLYPERTPGLIMTSQHWKPRKVTFAMAQTLHSKLKQEDSAAIEYLKSVDTVVMDEAHLLGDNYILNVLSFCSNAAVRYALSGSLMRRKDLGNWYLMGQFGQVLKHIPSAYLREAGIASKVRVYLHDIDEPKYTGNYENAEKVVIERNAYRNTFAALATINAAKKNWPCLVLVTRVEHGHIVKDIFESLGYNVPFLSGKDDITLRNEYVKLMRIGKVPIMIGTRIFNTGINVPRLRFIARLGAGKSEITSLQIPGRGSRKKSVFNWLFLLDFNDRTSKYFHAHSRRRVRLYKDEGYELRAIKDVTEIKFKRIPDTSSGSHNGTELTQDVCSAES